MNTPPMHLDLVDGQRRGELVPLGVSLSRKDSAAAALEDEGGFEVCTPAKPNPQGQGQGHGQGFDSDAHNTSGL